MLYTVDSDFHADMSEVIDSPEIKLRLLRYFDLLPEEEDHDEELGIILFKLLRSKSDDMNNVLNLVDANLETIYRVSFNLTPDKWTSRMVKKSMKEYSEYIESNGRPIEQKELSIIDILDLKKTLIKYFGLVITKDSNQDLSSELLNKIDWLNLQSKVTKNSIIKKLMIEETTLDKLVIHLTELKEAFVESK